MEWNAYSKAYSKTTKEITKYVAILSNLENEDYVKTVFDGVEYFVRYLQNIIDEELQGARRLIRMFPQYSFIKYDVKKPKILCEFVALV